MDHVIALKRYGIMLSSIFTRKGGSRGGLMVSALGSGSGGPGSSLGQGTALCSQARHFTLAQLYKWVPAECWG